MSLLAVLYDEIVSEFDFVNKEQQTMGSDKVKGYVLVKVQRLNRMGDMLPVRKERRNFDHGSLSGQIADLLSLNQRDLLLD